MPPSYGCLDCNRRFASVAAGRSHSRAKGHTFPACESCNKIFVSRNGLNNHLKHSSAHKNAYCSDCKRSFATEGAYVQHMAQSPIHRGRYCEECNRGFVDKSAYRQHLESSHQSYYCGECNRMFSDKASRDMHIANSRVHGGGRKQNPHPTIFINYASGQSEPQRRHPLSRISKYITRVPTPDYRCVVCPRSFSSSAAAFVKHKGSPVHRIRSFKCFFCDKLFKTPSAIAMHVESGCHCIVRHQVTAAVHQLKIIPQISIDRLIGHTSKPFTQIITYAANSSAYNGHGYECYICHSTFKTLARLNQHLCSPTHDDFEFRCPRCASEFQLISGFVQHIESGCCGIAKFNQIARQFRGLTGRFSRLLAF